MSRVPSSSWAVPFVLGAAAALTLVWAGNKASERNQHERHSRKPSSSESDASKGTNASSADTVEELMDKPDLDHRMLRKAEAVIQWRTTRLVLVIERCTNDHNYSAILRTAEALGIQVVYMIDPPKVDDGEDEVETGKPQQQLQQHITRTPEEVEARHQHHLFARNAQEWLDVKDYATAEDCVAALRKQGYQLWVTDLSQEACSLSMGNPSIPEKVALVMGTGTLLLYFKQRELCSNSSTTSNRTNLSIHSCLDHPQKQLVVHSTCWIKPICEYTYLCEALLTR
jgi:hypothetical protein